MRAWFLLFIFVFLAIFATLVLFVPASAQDRGSPDRASVPWDQETSSITSLPEGQVVTAPEDAPCTPAAEGAQRYSRLHKAILICDGRQWKAVQAVPLDEAQ